MKTVGIKNLKNSLSQYLNYVKAGERILITEHNKIVAELIPLTQDTVGSDLLEDYLTEQVKVGSMIRSTGKIQLTQKKNKQVFDKEKWDHIYQETRNDRL